MPAPETSTSRTAEREGMAEAAGPTIRPAHGAIEMDSGEQEVVAPDSPDYTSP